MTKIVTKNILSWDCKDWQELFWHTLGTQGMMQRTVVECKKPLCTTQGESHAIYDDHNQLMAWALVFWYAKGGPRHMHVYTLPVYRRLGLGARLVKHVYQSEQAKFYPHDLISARFFAAMQTRYNVKCAHDPHAYITDHRNKEIALFEQEHTQTCI